MEVATSVLYYVVVVTNKLELVASYSKLIYLVRTVEVGWDSKRQSSIEPRGVEVVGERIVGRDLWEEITAGICHVRPFDGNGSV